MKHKQRLGHLFILFVFILMLGGCSISGRTEQVVSPKSDLPSMDHFEAVRQVANDYLASDKVDSMTPEQLYRKVVQGKDAQYFLVDIRASEDFISSNIRGSVNIPYAQTANPKKLSLLPKDKTLVIIDYNGHWAAQTAATWNLLGYRAIPLLYGIQGWTRQEAPAGYEAFPAMALMNPLVTTESASSQYSLPALDPVQGSTEDFIRISTGTYLDRNYKGFISAEDLLGALRTNSGSNDNYVVDLRKPEHYQLGHLEGAINIPLAKLVDANQLKRLPLDKKLILIGYDGMDASQGARVLLTLGYNAVALKYGMSYWNGDEKISGIRPIANLVQEYYEMTPLNYAKPSTGAAGCG